MNTYELYHSVGPHMPVPEGVDFRGTPRYTGIGARLRLTDIPIKAPSRPVEPRTGEKAG